MPKLQPWISTLPSVEGSAGNGLDVLDDSNSSLEDAAQALEGFVLSHQREEKSSLSALKSSFGRVTPGQRALLWLLESGAVHDVAYVAHPTFLKTVTHCLVAEDGLEYLQHRILVKDNPLAPTSVAIGRDNSFWRGRLLLHTLEAQAYWTEKAMLLEDSVDTWLSMLRQAEDQRVFISPGMSRKWIIQLLSTCHSKLVVTGTKFEEFVSAHGFWSALTRDEWTFEVACLSMYHPDKGDASRILDILRRHGYSPNKQVCKMLDSKNPKAHQKLFVVLIHAAQLLARGGSLGDARWILDFGRAHIPDSFRMRKYSSEIEDDSQWKARRSEIAAGLADEHGNLKNSRDRMLLPEDKIVFIRRD